MSYIQIQTLFGQFCLDMEIMGTIRKTLNSLPDVRSIIDAQFLTAVQFNSYVSWIAHRSSVNLTSQMQILNLDQYIVALRVKGLACLLPCKTACTTIASQFRHTAESFPMLQMFTGAFVIFLQFLWNRGVIFTLLCEAPIHIR